MRKLTEAKHQTPFAQFRSWIAELPEDIPATNDLHPLHCAPFTGNPGNVN